MPDSKVWNVRCKNFDICGNYLEYSDGSYKRGLARGESAGQYCSTCQPAHRKVKSTLAAPYFRKPKVDTNMLRLVQGKGGLGAVIHAERKREALTVKGSFDPNKFGVTPENVIKVFKWLDDPDHQVAIIVGPTGSGKSTAFPYYMMYPPSGIRPDLFTRRGQILITQPRIVAAQGITEYLGHDLIGIDAGKGMEVGFQHSQSKSMDSRNALAMCTDGTLINMMQKGDLGKFSAIVVDEAHELSFNISLILRLLKEKLPLYPHLKLIIASATINAESFQDYFGKHTAEVIYFEGKRKFTYTPNKDGSPIWREPERALPYDNMPELLKRIAPALANDIYDMLDAIAEGKKPSGDVLAFLPGIKTVEEAILKIRSKVNQNEKLADRVVVYGLYRDKTEKEKKMSLERLDNRGKPLADDKIMVVIATNIAEASITIDSVVYDWDTGLENQSQYDPDKHVTTIPTVITSKANAKQRWGRAGRTRDGEARTMYTEEQFQTLFTEYPVTEIERGYPGDLILSATASGVTDLGSLWIKPPALALFDSAIKDLKISGALDQVGRITDYGLALRNFSYPAQVADLIMMSDQFGVAVEIATLIPVIKNGGFRNLLDWSWSWDAYTKRHVMHVQKCLYSGCHDDIEFVLKLFSAWNDMPWAANVKGMTPQQQANARHEWAEKNFVREEILEKVLDERDTILSNFFGHKKDDSFRNINFSLIPRTKLLISYCLPESGSRRYSDVGAPGPYEFKVMLEPNDISYANFEMAIPSSWGGLPHRGEEPINVFSLAKLVRTYAPAPGKRDEEKKDKEKSSNLRRYFLDQLIEYGAIYKFSPTSDPEMAILGDLIQNPRPVEGSFTVKAQEDADTDDEQESSRRSKRDNSSAKTSVEKKQISQQVVMVNNSRKSVALTDTVKVVGFTEVMGESIPVVNRIPEVDPFDAFTAVTRTRSVVTVTTAGYFQAPTDKTAALIVIEQKSGLEILVDAESISFSSSAYPAVNMSAGLNLSMTVAVIDRERKRVKLSFSSSVESELNVLLGKNGARVEVDAIITDVRDDGQVTYYLERSKPERGVFIMVSSFNTKLQPEELVVGTKHRIAVFRKTKKEHSANLSKLPDSVAKQLDKKNTSYPELSWKRGLLMYSGHMPYSVLTGLLELSDNEAYRNAVTRIWWMSNKLDIANIFSKAQADAYASIQKGDVIEGKVTGVTENALYVEVAPGIDGQLHANGLSRKGLSISSYQVGQSITVVVFKCDPANRKIALDPA